MIKEIWESFRDNIKERTTNPFLGTLLIVWILHNWDLVFGVFNFNPNTKQEDKINYIKNHFNKTGFLENLLYVVLVTIGILIATYILLNISRLIVNFFEKKITPWIYKITDSNSIVLKTEYDKLDTAYRHLEERFETERQNKNRAIQESEEYAKALYDFKHSKNETSVNRNYDNQTELNVIGAEHINPNISANLNEIFPGTWKNEFTYMPTGEKREEIFNIKNDNQYFVGDVAWFSIDDTTINQATQTLSFTKNGLSTNKGRILHNSLTIIELGKKYEGMEDKNHKVIYTRIA